MSSHLATMSLLPHFLSFHKKLYWIILRQHIAVVAVFEVEEEGNETGRRNHKLIVKQQLCVHGL